MQDPSVTEEYEPDNNSLHSYVSKLQLKTNAEKKQMNYPKFRIIPF